MRFLVTKTNTVLPVRHPQHVQLSEFFGTVDLTIFIARCANRKNIRYE